MNAYLDGLRSRSPQSHFGLFSGLYGKGMFFPPDASAWAEFFNERSA